MSLYLAKKVSTADSSTAEFLAKKLSGFAPCPINSLAITGRSKYPEVAYAMYRTNIDAFVFATYKKERTFAQAEGFENIMAKSTLPVTLHNLAFSPTAKLNPDHANLLLQKLGKEASMRYIGKTLEYTIPHPVFDDLNRYLSAGNPNHTVGPNRFTPDGYRAYVKTLTCLEAFLSTNYYPAFKDLESEVSQPVPMSLGFTGVEDAAKKRHFYAYTSDLQGNDEKVAEYHSTLKRLRLSTEADPESSMTVDQTVYKDSEKVGVMSFHDANSSVIYAKPSGKPSSINFGGPGACPKLPGIVFPYFRGMTRPDFTTIREILVNHFFRLFGDDFESCKANLAMMKKGINNLCNTEAGMEITHMMKGVELSLSTQTRLYLVFDKGYRGFVLLGGNFSVWDGSVWVLPVSTKDLQHELSMMDTHKLSIARIASMLSKVEITSSKSLTTVSPEELDCAVTLIGKMAVRDFSDYDDAAEFDKYLQSLMWPEPYLQLSPETFHQFLSQAFSDEPLGFKGESIYIPSCKAEVTDRVFQLLGRFGPDAPSLWNTRGEIMSVVSRVGKKSKEKEALEQPAVPKEIIILPKPTLIALKDWRKVVKDGAVSFNYKERAREYRGHVVTSDAMKKKIWETLQKGLLEVDALADGEPDKKKPRKEVVVANADDLLALW